MSSVLHTNKTYFILKNLWTVLFFYKTKQLNYFIYFLVVLFSFLFSWKIFKNSQISTRIRHIALFLLSIFVCGMAGSSSDGGGGGAVMMRWYPTKQSVLCATLLCDSISPTNVISFFTRWKKILSCFPVPIPFLDDSDQNQ